MVSRHPLWPLFLLIVFSTACQQRYAYIPKVKVEPREAIAKEKPVPTPIPETESVSLHLVTSFEILERYEAAQVQDTIFELNLKPNLRLNRKQVSAITELNTLALDDSLNASKPRPVRFKDLDQGDQFAIYGISSLAVILTSAAVALLLIPVVLSISLEAYLLQFLFMAVILGLVIFALYLLVAHLLIKKYLGRRLAFQDILNTMVVTSSAASLAGLIHPILLLVVLLAAAIYGIVKLIQGSAYKQSLH